MVRAWALRLCDVRRLLVVDPTPARTRRPGFFRAGRRRKSQFGSSRYPEDAAAANKIRMMSHDLERVAESLVADGKGILAADETAPTLTKRFDILGIASTEQSRRTYREMLFTSPGAADFISGAIMYDETIRQKTSDGMPFAKELESQGILPGIKVDTGAKPFAASPDETVTEGLDGLRDRLSGVSQNGRPLREVAGGDSCNRFFAKRRLCERKRACPGSICFALSGAGLGADRRA